MQVTLTEDELGSYSKAHTYTVAVICCFVTSLGVNFVCLWQSATITAQLNLEPRRWRVSERNVCLNQVAKVKERLSTGLQRIPPYVPAAAFSVIKRCLKKLC